MRLDTDNSNINRGITTVRDLSEGRNGEKEGRDKEKRTMVTKKRKVAPGRIERKVVEVITEENVTKEENTERTLSHNNEVKIY